MAESVIEEVLSLKRWVIVGAGLNLLSLLVLGSIALGVSGAIRYGKQEIGTRLNELAAENARLRDENLRLQKGR